MSIITVRSNLPSQPDLVIIKNTLFVPSIVINKKNGEIFCHNDSRWQKLTQTVYDLKIPAHTFHHCHADDLCDCTTKIYECEAVAHDVVLPTDLNDPVGTVTYHDVMEESKVIKSYISQYPSLLFRMPGLGIMSYQAGVYHYQWGVSTDPVDEDKLVLETPDKAKEVIEFKDALIELMGKII